MTRLFGFLPVLLQITVVLMAAGCKGGPAPDFSGQWAEKSAERVVAVFPPAASGGYGVQIGWRETGLAQYEAWDMSAVAGKRGTLAYSDGRFVRLSFERDGDTEYVEDTVYIDGEGSFLINCHGELVWTDAKDGSKTVVIRTDLNGDDASIIAPELTALMEYDAANDTQYFDTLRVYLLEERNIPRASEKLIIHRTTLLYRLRKIESLVTLNLDDPWRRLYLMLSLKILDGTQA